MTSVSVTSIGDVEWQLLSSTPIIQSQGFCNLLSLLKSSKDYHEKKAAFSLLWKALSVGSEAVVGWITVILSTLIDDSVVSKEEATRECLLALTQRSKVSDIVHFLLLITDDLTECVLTIIRQAPKTKINEVVAQLKFVPFERSFPCMMRLILGDELEFIEKDDLIRFVLSKGSIECVEMLTCFDEVVVRRGMLELAVQCATRNRLILKTSQLFSTELLSSMKLDYAICLFEICEHLSRRSLEHSLALIRNPTFPKHPSLVSSLSTLYACISEWSRNQCMPRQLTADVLQLVKEALSSAKAAEISYQQTELSYDCSLAEYLAWISESDERLCSFLKLWLQRRANEVTILSVNFLIGLMPKMNAENVELYLQLLTVFADSNPSLVNEIFFVILPLYSRTDLPKETILECMARLATHRLVVGPVLKLLLVISQQPKCAERLKAIELIGDIWSQHENLLDQIASLTTTDDSKGDMEFQHAKMNLIRRICLKSDRAEEFLPCLSTLSNSSGPLLSDAIFAIADLCRAEVLDVSAVLKQLEVRMQQPDSEPALVAYCDLLATSAADPDQEDVLNKCIRKLWALKGHPTEIVRAAAWKALSSFQLTSVKTALDSAQESLFSNWIQSLNRASEYLQQRKVSEEFGRFMHKMVACELDDFGRSLYTTVEGTSRLDPILETACHLRDMINNASGVAQLCLLGAASSAIQLPTKRSSSTMQHLYRLFVQVSAPTEDDWRPVMRYFAAWRMAVGWAYEILSRARQTHPGRDPPPNWARDQICETMKRALSQNQKAQLNVVVALAFVAERSEFDRSWMVSTLEYLLTCCSSDHTCRSPLLFQQKISYNQEWYSITRLATALFCTKLDSETLSSFVNLSEELWSSTERHLIDQWARSIMSGSGEVEDEGISCVTSYLLRFSSWNVELIDSLCSRSEATAIGYMVGADPVMIGCLVDQMRLDASAEERFLELISKDHLERIDVEAIFESFSNMSSDSRQMHAAVLARKAEKVVKDNCDDMAIVNAVIEGLSWCHLCGTALRDENEPSRYKSLPEGSVLKAIVDALITFEMSSQANLLEAILGSLVDQRRKSDERVLPPLDWRFLYSYCNMKYAALEPLLIALSIQQHAYKIFCRLLSAHRSTPLSLQSASVIASHLGTLQCSLSAFQMRFIIELLFETVEANDHHTNILKHLAALSSQNVDVVEKWAQKIPPIVSAVSIRHAMFETFVDFEIPEHTYSNNAMLALWALTKCVSRVDLRSVVHFLKLIAREKRPTCFLILAYNFGKLLVEDRITLMLQLVSISRLDSQSSKDDFIYWRIFVTLCNVDRSSEIPVALFSSCDQVTWNRVESRVCEHFRALRSVAKFCAEVSKISYLFMDVLLAMRADQNCGSEMLRKTAKALLRTALAIDTKRLIENLEETHLWNEVFT